MADRKRQGEILRELRQKAGLSQRELAERVGLDPYTIVAQLEAGIGRIKHDEASKWAEALDVDAADLDALVGPMRPSVH